MGTAAFFMPNNLAMPLENSFFYLLFFLDEKSNKKIKVIRQPPFAPHRIAKTSRTITNV
jgi:hypothetical protein